jgi:hypothetical protein
VLIHHSKFFGNDGIFTAILFHGELKIVVLPIQLAVTHWKRKVKQEMVLKYKCEGYNATP